jgi:hypothetical protein
MMDARVKPAHDGYCFVTAPALQRTASQDLRAALRPGHDYGYFVSSAKAPFQSCGGGSFWKPRIRVS